MVNVVQCWSGTDVIDSHHKFIRSSMMPFLFDVCTQEWLSFDKESRSWNVVNAAKMKVIQVVCKLVCIEAYVHLMLNVLYILFIYLFLFFFSMKSTMRMIVLSLKKFSLSIRSFARSMLLLNNIPNLNYNSTLILHDFGPRVRRQALRWKF